MDDSLLIGLQVVRRPLILHTFTVSNITNIPNKIPNGTIFMSPIAECIYIKTKTKLHILNIVNYRSQ